MMMMIARMPDESDAKQLAPRRTGGDYQDAPDARTTWKKTTQQDLKSVNLSLNEAIDVAQNRPLWR